MQFLVITSDHGDVNWLDHAELLREEARHVWNLYKSSILRNIWFSENKDALLVFDCDTENAVARYMDQFPLVKRNLIDYKVTSLLPYTGFERLMNGTDTNDPAD